MSSAMIFQLAGEMPVAACSGAHLRFVGLGSDALPLEPRTDGLPTPSLKKIRQPVLPYCEAIASAKLLPEHQHDQRGRESFFASQGDLYLLVLALAGERDQEAARRHQHVAPSPRCDAGFSQRTAQCDQGQPNQISLGLAVADDSDGGYARDRFKVHPLNELRHRHRLNRW